MSHQEFDEQIRQSLESIVPNTQSAAAWERLAQRLEQDGSSSSEDVESETQDNIDAKFDQAIRERIQQTTAPTYHNNHWLTLSERLAVQEERLTWIYRNKFAEVSILILLLLAFINILNVPVAKIEALAAPILQFTSYQNNDESEQQRVVNIGTLTVSETPIDAYTPHAESISNAALTPATRTKRVSMQLIKKLNRKIALLPIPEPQVKSEHFTEIAAQLPLRSSSIIAKSKSSKDDAHYLYAPQLQKKHYWALGFVAVLNLNQIYTPTDNFFGKEILAHNDYSLGGGGGFLISKETNKYALETGLVYLTKKYQPKQLSIIGSNSRGVKYKETLRNVQINLLELPFNYRYKFLRKEKLDYFATIGGTLNIITQANYDNNRSYYVPAYALAQLDGYQPPSEIQRAKKFNDGLFEGGTVQENVYLTAQASIGLEYKFNTKISFFNQATYQRHITINGIGANNNSFHAYSFLMGLKTKF